jgi:stage II sporulation SpoE-like protein
MSEEVPSAWDSRTFEKLHSGDQRVKSRLPASWSQNRASILLFHSFEAPLRGATYSSARTAVCRAYARASFSGENELFAAMEKVNAALAVDLKEGRFVTFVAAICTRRNPRVELLSAGHGPLFLYLLKHDCFKKMDDGTKVVMLDKHSKPEEATNASK